MMTGKIAWVSMTVLAMLVAAYAGGILVIPAARSPFVRDLFGNLPVSTALHLSAGIVAIVLGAFQVNSRLRARFLPMHRWSGRIYVVAVLVGGVAGLILASNSFGGLVTHFGFGFMAVFWLSTTVIAYVSIRRGDVQAHRAWMLRSYALTLAAVTLRIYIPLSQVAGIEFEQAYQTISWLCWVPNLLIVEWFVLSRQKKMPATANG